jgi:GNAT superfamily N-acetyltransferase
VHVAGWRSAYAALLPPDVLANLSVSARAQMWQQRLTDTDVATWVAEDQEHRIAGFASAGPSRDDADATTDYRDEATDNRDPATATADARATGELYALYVHPDRWANGVGRDLITTAMDHLRPQFATATLWVLRGNARARAFYEGRGWRPDGAARTEQRYGATLDEVRYRRELRE